ncbi:TadE/TadG family type IV pilus assembly protein [Aeromicrobium sp. CF4.19]|uniref:TadE/TadG family type IV pilus assembly protein n=1 Tax=Aeromicrobium sp. CF4.19 TaxID=3373082 RepID=UPI003EE81B3A
MHASRERGAAAIEFALVVPLLVTFIFGIVEGGTRYAQQSEVNHWAFVAARDLSIDPGKSATSVVDSLKGGDETEYSVSSTPADACGVGGTTAVTVTVSATKVSPTRLFGDYTITGEGVARCEN